MPKIKTNKSAAKRFRVTGTGKIKRNKANKRHILSSKGKKRKRHLRQAGIAVTGEQRLAALPQRLVSVHAAAVVLEDGLGHEGDGFAVLVGNVLHDVFVEQHVVGGLDQRIEAQVDFGLAAGGDFVVMAFNV